MADNLIAALDKLAFAPPKPDNDPLVLRIQDVFHFGWGIEELIYQAGLKVNPPVVGVNNAASLTQLEAWDRLFPADLAHKRSLDDIIDNIVHDLTALEPQLFGGAPTDLNGAPWHFAADVRAAIGALAVTKQDTLVALSDKIKAWDDAILDKLLQSQDQTTSILNNNILTAYEVGKALSKMQWGIALDNTADHHAWQDMFSDDRMAKLQRHLDTLLLVANAQVITIVSRVLSYWKKAINRLDTIIKIDPEKEKSYEGLKKSIPDPAKLQEFLTAMPDHQRAYQVVQDILKDKAAAYQELLVAIAGKDQAYIDLRAALEEQFGYLYDLMSGRRKPSTFNVLGIVSTLTEGLTKQLYTRARRFVPLIIVGIVAVALLVIIILSLSTNGTNGVGGATGILGTVATIFGGGYLALSQRVSGLGRILGGSAPPVSSVPGTAGAPGAAALTSGTSSTTGNLPSSGAATGGGVAVSVAALSDDVLHNVINQIRLEELFLAVSEPLIDFVLEHAIQEVKNQPEADTLARVNLFFKLIGDETSNIDLLKPLFTGLLQGASASVQERS